MQLLSLMLAVVKLLQNNNNILIIVTQNVQLFYGELESGRLIFPPHRLVISLASSLDLAIVKGKLHVSACSSFIIIFSRNLF